MYLYTTVCVITMIKICCGLTRHNILTTVMTHTVVCKSTYHAKPHSICFLPQYQRQRKFFSWEHDQDRDKERESVVYKFLAMWLVYCPKYAFLIGYYNKKQLPQEFWIERSDRKVERLFAKIQLQQFSYCKYSSSITIILRQNTHIGICNGAAMEEAISKGQSTGVWRKKALRDTMTRAAWCGLLYTTAN